MRKAEVLYKDLPAGIVIQHDNGTFSFSYYDNWLIDSSKPSIGISLPKTNKEYYSPYLFPLFYNMLPEGSNKSLICEALRIDSDDYFGILMNIATVDTIGAIKIRKMEVI
jgi:HipA-like protein